MSRDLTDTVDIALDRLHEGEALASILEQHASQAEELRPLLAAAAALEPLHQVEMPAPERQLAERNRFLAEVAGAAFQPTSPSPVVRLRAWFAQLFTWEATAAPIHRREPRRMNALMLKFVLVVTMLFGSAGGTAVAAVNSLPGSPLYPAKLAIEQARLQVAANPADRAQLHMILAQVRVQEMEQLALSDREPGEAAMTQLQQHLEQALQLAAEMPDEAMQGTLARWQQQIEQQEKQLQQAQSQAAEPAQEPLRQAMQLLQQTQQQLQVGLKDGQAFRWRHALDMEPEDVTGTGEDCTDCKPAGDAYQNGPQAGQPSSNEPSGSQYRECTDCEPTGDQHQYGAQPDQPGPGEPGGPAEPPCDGCEPAGDQHRYGPQPDESGPEAPGGPGGGTCAECVPDGEQQQYGPQPGEPGPEAPGGAGDSTCAECVPDGDQQQYGPQPDQPGAGQPGGAVDPPCDDCEPDGEQQQYGPQPTEPGPEDPGGTHDGDGGSGGGSGGGGRSR